MTRSADSNTRKPKVQRAALAVTRGSASRRWQAHATSADWRHIYDTIEMVKARVIVRMKGSQQNGNA